MKSQEKLVTWFMEAPLLAFFFSALAIYYTQTFFCNLLLLLYNLDSLVSLGRKVEKVGLFWHKLLPFVHSVPSMKNLFRNSKTKNGAKLKSLQDYFFKLSKTKSPT